jgi:predicted histone-like DNA-binding protein
MSIPYKVVQRGQPGVAGGGVKKLYAAVVTTGETTIDELTKDIEKFSALSEADIRGVIIALENVIQNKLAEGKIVRLEKLGSLYPALSSKGVETEAQVTQAIIKSLRKLSTRRSNDRDQCCRI